ncbi:MAG TPA: pyridoxamine 5'-phosphate oxidase [Myxococcota bacterium]|nr:pyridoxamine 5'-phosphate oxidase [Myxococcota bacterium]
MPKRALTWSELEREAPEFAAAGRKLLYQLGPGAPALAMLATSRADGGPRVHPVCPTLCEEGLYLFVIGHSPKRADLARDGRYALHAFPGMTDDESFYCTGPASEIRDPALRTRAESQVVHRVKPDEVLFELRLERILHTVWLRPRTPDTEPVYARWRA